MKHYYVLYKPYGYLSQFSDEAKHKGLNHLIKVEPDVYPAGRLDVDSEGLLLLTNDNFLKHHLLNPENKHKRTYHVQVDGTATSVHLNLPQQGVEITIEGKPYKTLPPVSVNLLNEVSYPDRNPPVSFSKHIPTSWIELVLTEGKNRQVRKMTAAVGIPTLRLIRNKIEAINIKDYQQGELKELSQQEIYKLLKI